MTNDAIEALRRLRNICEEASDLVRGLECQLCCGAIEEEEPEEELPLALEDVRAVLAELARLGHAEAIRSLLHKYGADKLSEVDVCHYRSLLADAKELNHAA